MTAPSSIANAGRQLRRGAGWNLAALVVSQGFGFTLSVLVARLLAPSEAGVLLALLALTSIVSTVGAVALDRVAVIEVARSPEDAQLVRSVAAMTVLLGLLTSLVTVGVVASVPIADVDLTGTVVLLAGTFAGAEVVRVVLSELPRSWMQPQMSFWLGLPARLVLSVAALVYVEATGELDVGSAMACFAVTSAALAVAGLVHVLRHTGGGGTSLGRSAAITATGLPLMLASLARQLLDQGDILVVSAFFEPEDVAAYAIATRLANLLGSIVVAVGVASLPIAARPGADDDPDVARPIDEPLARAAATLAAIPALLGAAVLLVAAAPLVRLGFGDEYALAVPLLRLLVLGQVINALTGICGAVMLRAGRRRVILVTYVACALVALPLESAIAAAGSLRLVALVSGLGLASANLVLFRYARVALGTRCGPYWRRADVARATRSVRLR